jgi:structural maintenance of chromosome 3 (chondroitin sulfate proteoglycan 6)
LTQFSNVNQKALEQFNDGKEKAQILMKEKLEIDSAYSSIQQLIDSLEHKKYEAIQFTYRQVSTFFKEIFHKLVPEGKAFIDMIYSDVQSSSESGSSQTSQSSVGVPASGKPKSTISP